MKNDKSLIYAAVKAIILGLLLTACAEELAPSGEAKKPEEIPGPVELVKNTGANLERIAEIERAGAFFPGLALAESGIREKAGDINGAAVAAYKELAWAYGYGNAVKSQVEEGLQNALAFIGDSEGEYLSREYQAAAAIKGCMAFAREEWGLAEELLSTILRSDEEPDSFLRWMILVCALEGKTKEADNSGSQTARSAYGAIRARYALFPEYWYRGARAFAAEDSNIAAAYAEQCINSSPGGPFAASCRKILADHLGLGASEKTPDIRTRAEIENTIRASVSLNNPSILEELFPLINLPENPYTVYALGAMKTLASVPEFRSFFWEESLKSQGRLGERLNYISRG